MKKLLVLLSVAFVVGCTEKDDFIVEQADGLVDVTFSVGASEAGVPVTGPVSTDTKVAAGWIDGVNRMLWSAGDSIGVFFGAGNVNRRFGIASGVGTPSASFSGQIQSVTTPTTLVAYYPYSRSAVSVTAIPFPDYTHQVFEGTFEKEGTFTSFGRYALLFGYVNSLTVDKSWPAGEGVSFSSLAGLARFGISSTLSESINVRSVGMISDQNSFLRLTAYNIYTGALSGYYCKTLSTDISDKNPLVLNGSETKYVQMATTRSQYGEEVVRVYVDALSSDGRNVRYLIPKSVDSNKNFDFGKRVSISVPITPSTTTQLASRVKLTTLSDVTSLSAPIFTHSDDYVAADSWWGDSVIEKYEAGRVHKFLSSGEHTASFNHWGEAPVVTVESLVGIKAIDFSQAF